MEATASQTAQGSPATGPLPLPHRRKQWRTSTTVNTVEDNGGCLSDVKAFLGRRQMRASRIQLSETLGAASWPELGLVFESNSTACFVPVIHQAFPPVVCTSLPFQQESVYPYPARQDLAWLRVRRDVLREAVKAFAEQSGHRL